MNSTAVYAAYEIRLDDVRKNGPSHTVREIARRVQRDAMVAIKELALAHNTSFCPVCDKECPPLEVGPRQVLDCLPPIVGDRYEGRCPTCAITWTTWRTCDGNSPPTWTSPVVVRCPGTNVNTDTAPIDPPPGH